MTLMKFLDIKQLKAKLLLGTILLLFCLSGCATDNEFLLQCRLFPRRSDKIPGLMPASERIGQIQDKAKYGTTASQPERELLVSQLIRECASPDANIRCEAVKAISVIPHQQRIDHLKESILDDVSPVVRIAACKGLFEGKSDIEQWHEISHVLRNVYNTDNDIEVRVTAIRLLGTLPNSSKELKNANRLAEDPNLMLLGDALYNRSTVIRYEAMSSLQKYTGHDYGQNAEKWDKYMNYVKGIESTIPPERSIAERMPKPQFRMLR